MYVCVGIGMCLYVCIYRCLSVCVCMCLYVGFYMKYITLYLTDIAITCYWYPLQVRPWRIIYNTIQCLHVCLCTVVRYELHIYVYFFFTLFACIIFCCPYFVCSVAAGAHNLSVWSSGKLGLLVPITWRWSICLWFMFCLLVIVRGFLLQILFDFSM